MPSSRVLAFTDPYQYQLGIRGVDRVEVFPTAGGEFRAELIQIDFDRLWIQQGQENLPRIIHAVVNKNRTGIEFPVSENQAAFRHHGINLVSGEIVADDGQSTSRLSFGSCHWGGMSLRLEDLASRGRALVGREITRPLAAHIIRPAPPLMERLLGLHSEAARLAKTGPDALAHPKVARALEEALVHAMIQCLTEGTVIKTDSAKRHHTAIIAKLEEFLAANGTHPLYLTEICTATGVSESTLRRCCNEHLGMGPVRYLWLRRMHLARLALLQADAARETVTGIATDHGFWELGRFSVQYRRLFGESPSASLHRLPSDRPAAQNRPFDLPATDFA